MRTVLAGDLGGTKCRFALVSADLRVHRVTQFATIRERAAFLAAFDAAIADVMAATPDGLEPPAAAGFGTAGVIPLGTGAIDYAPNLPLDGYPLDEHVRARFGLPTTVLNDGRASAWGEYLHGEARGSDPLLCLFFGTGVGIGLMVGGKPYAGATNAAGEIGHTTYLPGGRRCACGRSGHFEAYCGGRAVTERALEVLGPAPDGDWSVGEVVELAGHDARAQDILEQAAVAACALVENACVLLNPAAVVLGGGMLEGWPDLRQRIIAHVRARTRHLIHEDLEFVPSIGGSDAVLWGAAAATGALPLAKTSPT